MRLIPTAVHGLMDFTMGLLLIVTPWLDELEPQRR